MSFIFHKRSCQAAGRCEMFKQAQGCKHAHTASFEQHSRLTRKTIKTAHLLALECSANEQPFGDIPAPLSPPYPVGNDFLSPKIAKGWLYSQWQRCPGCHPQPGSKKEWGTLEVWWAGRRQGAGRN